MTSNVVTYNAALEIASHEAMIRQTYKDSIGVLTWNVGMTNATGHTVERYIGKPASIEHCMSLYVWALEKYAVRVRRAFAGHELTEAQFAAALSFDWNTGAILRATWVQKWRAGDIGGAREDFMNYSKPTSIISRRKKERDLFFKGRWTNKGTILEYTKVSQSSMSPVWSSAKRVDISQELKAAFGSQLAVKEDTPSSNPVSNMNPTLTPVKTDDEAGSASGWQKLIASVIQFVASLFKRR